MEQECDNSEQERGNLLKEDEIKDYRHDINQEKKIARQQTARIQKFCQKLMETDEERAERIKRKQKIGVYRAPETEEQRAARLQASREEVYKQSLEKGVGLNSNPMEKGEVNMSESTRADRSDTEKVKRRMIRTIGRLLSEKKPEDELWEYMKKEYGKKSRILWNRMRFLTLKKLKMLFDVDDVVNNVPKVARMTLTDWLIFDLVLVHEKFDLIDVKKIRSDKSSSVLSKLFALVLRFNIEDKVGEDLANAWIAATVHYNATGHQCSPMLLQRRWYQLKEVTRATFYKFWFIFRGNMRQLDKAKQELPISELQRDVALRYSHIITEPFKQWEECIKDRTVIMPEEFEMKMRSVNIMKPTDLTGPDLVLVEPKINTIDLCDSDDDITKKPDDENSPTPTVPITVKSEPIDLDDDDDDETEVPTEEPTDRNFDDEIQRLQLVSEEISIGSDDEGQNYDEGDSDDNANDDDAIRKAVESINNVENDKTAMKIVPQTVEQNSSEAKTSQDNVMNLDNNKNSPNLNLQDHENEETDFTHSEPDLVVKVEKDTIVMNSTEAVLPVISTITSLGVAVENENPSIENDILNKNLDQSIIKQESEIITEDNDINGPFNPQLRQNDDNLIQQKNNVQDLARNIGEYAEQIHNANQNKVIETVTAEDNIIEDDIIKLTYRQDNVKLFQLNNQDDIVNVVSNNQDDIVKLVSPSVKKVDEFSFNEVPMDLDFADDGIQLVDDGIEYVESGDEGETEKSEDKEPKIDVKLLMDPVVYTTKVDKMSIFRYIPFSKEVKDKTVMDQIDFLSKPVSKLALLAELEIQKQKAKEEESRKIKILPVIVESKNIPEIVNAVVQETLKVPDIQNKELMVKSEPEETTQEDTAESSDEEELPRIKPTSYLLRKPNNRSYNPIQLCKNPDFNTRLKRLPVSFYTYPRNRILLNECKPMTIDLSKAFESKLFNGTLYLTETQSMPCGTPANSNITSDITTSSVPVTAPPVHSLIDVDKILEEELKKRVVERSRTINLPDITEVRRINQQLLTAEVMPLRKSLKDQTTDISMEHTVSENPPIVDNSTVCDNPAVIDNTIVIDDDQSSSHPSQVCSNKNTEDLYEDTVEPLPPIPYLEPIIPQSKTKITTSIKTTADERDNTNKNDNSLNKTRKQYRKNLQPRPNWLSSRTQPVDNSDLLLTTDTLYKMLFAIDPEATTNSTHMKYVKETLQNKVVFAKQTIYQKRVKKYGLEEETDQVQATKKKKNTQTNLKQEEQVPTLVKAKVNVVYDRSKSVQTRKKYCCWARKKIDYLKGTIHRIRKHTPCDEICKCCCATALANHLVDLNEQIEKSKEQKHLQREQLQKEKEKLTQEEEILKRACESIESVVQNVQEKKEGPRVYTVNKEPVKPVALTIVSTDENEPIYLEPRDTAVVPEKPISIDYKKQTPEPSILQKMVEARKFTSESKSNTPIKTYGPQKGLEWSTCPCNRPILKQFEQRTIVIDGTNGCAFHIENNQSNKKKDLRGEKKGKLYINKKAASDRPIFIGKNKLLLTNIKREQPALETSPVAAVPAADNLQMPEGVQIILLPNGTLTYTVDPNAHLTENQLAVMPTILAAIQRQINAGNLTMVPTDPVVGDISQNDIIGFQDVPNNNLNNPGNPPIVETIDLDSNEEPNDSIPTTSQMSDTEVTNRSTNNTIPENDILFEAKVTSHPHSPKSDKMTSGNPEMTFGTASTDKVMEVDNTQTKPSPDNIKSSTNETSEGSEPKKNTETETSTEIVQDIEDKLLDEKKTPQNNRKSLLSDLMEMSGIYEEDAVPAPAVELTCGSETAFAPVPTPIPTDPELLLTKTTIFSTSPRLTPIAPKPSPPKTLKDVYADLSTVNSFAELKYAYENNGLFFKLDLDSGVIVPITLCIKKKGRNAAASSTLQSIIDLTDDNDIADDEKVTFNTNSTDTEHNIKTTTVFKRVLDEVKSSASVKQYPKAGVSKNQRPNILVRKSKLLKKEDRSLLKYYVISPSKKPAPKPIEINEDSDAPMEEEYLETSEDESDDEPLAKKAKRAAESRQTFENIEKQVTSLDSTQNIEAEGDATLESTINEDEEEVMPSAVAQQTEGQPDIPKPTHLVLTRNEVHETVPIDAFYQNNGDDSDSDDCILGV